jgi:hypothetical protein
MHLYRLDDIQNGRRARPIAQLTRQVDYTAFRINYWKHLPLALTRKIPVDLAFVDIMGVIKGSASSHTNLKPLSRKDYVMKRWKLAPNFSLERERDCVYSIYEHYEAIKSKRGELDDTDRVVHIFKALLNNDYLREQVEGLLHEVYVDGK